MKPTERIKFFIGHVITETNKKGISVHLENTNWIESNASRCSGYFCDEDKCLKVAVRKSRKRWLSVFIHEYCHFLQWKNHSKVWNAKKNRMDTYQAAILLDDFLDNGKKLSKDKLQTCLTLCRDIEEECERMAVDIIDVFDIPLNKEEYIQKANAYLYFWTTLPKTQKWFSKKAPYDVPEIRKLLPKTFPKSFDKLPKGFLTLVEDHCI